VSTREGQERRIVTRGRARLAPLALAGWAFALAGCAAALVGCASAPPPPRPAAPAPLPTLAAAERERPYLLEPTAGYPQDFDSALAADLASGHRALLERGDVDAARRAAEAVLAARPGAPPAQVLAGQADLVAGDYPAVIARLLPVGDAQPTYTASQLTLGRAAELAGDIPLAYAAYRAVAARSPRAFERTGEIHPRAIEIVGNRLGEALARGRIPEAEKQLELLREWAAAEVATQEAARKVAVAKGDARAELAAVQALVRRRPDDRELAERQVDLEFAVGDPTTGLQLIQNLADRNPRDAALAEKLAAAKFRWRISLLPPGVQAVAARPELNRAELAVLLYWLIPEVRYAKPAAGRIATDVLDHPQREEIVRVVNLGLLDVDSTLHRFSPGAAARRGTAVAALTRLLGRSGQRVECLAGTASAGPRTACQAAARCALVASEEDCLPGAPLAGADAVEMIRRTLELLGSA